MLITSLSYGALDEVKNTFQLIYAIERFKDAGLSVDMFPSDSRKYAEYYFDLFFHVAESFGWNPYVSEVIEEKYQIQIEDCFCLTTACNPKEKELILEAYEVSSISPGIIIEEEDQVILVWSPYDSDPCLDEILDFFFFLERLKEEAKNGIKP